jgi:type IV secretory pathway VirB2 component (pilin)
MRREKRSAATRTVVAAILAALAAGPAMAGLPNLNTAVANLTAILTGVSVAVVTLATMWVGFETLHRGAQWEDVKRIVIGAVIIGGAAALAAMII